MAYIVPKEIPNSCSHCPFSALVFSHPWWCSNKPNKKGYRCQADSELRTIEMDFNDNTTKAEWCPLKQMGD